MPRNSRARPGPKSSGSDGSPKRGAMERAAAKHVCRLRQLLSKYPDSVRARGATIQLHHPTGVEALRDVFGSRSTASDGTVLNTFKKAMNNYDFKLATRPRKEEWMSFTHRHGRFDAARPDLDHLVVSRSSARLPSRAHVPGTRIGSGGGGGGSGAGAGASAVASLPPTEDSMTPGTPAFGGAGAGGASRMGGRAITSSRTAEIAMGFPPEDASDYASNSEDEAEAEGVDGDAHSVGASTLTSAGSPLHFPLSPSAAKGAGHLDLGIGFSDFGKGMGMGLGRSSGMGLDLGAGMGEAPGASFLCDIKVAPVTTRGAHRRASASAASATSAAPARATPTSATTKTTTTAMASKTAKAATKAIKALDMTTTSDTSSSTTIATDIGTIDRTAIDSTIDTSTSTGIGAATIGAAAKRITIVMPRAPTAPVRIAALATTTTSAMASAAAASTDNTLMPLTSLPPALAGSVFDGTFASTYSASTLTSASTSASTSSSARPLPVMPTPPRPIGTLPPLGGAGVGPGSVAAGMGMGMGGAGSDASSDDADLDLELTKFLDLDLDLDLALVAEGILSDRTSDGLASPSALAARGASVASSWSDTSEAGKWTPPPCGCPWPKVLPPCNYYGDDDVDLAS